MIRIIALLVLIGGLIGGIYLVQHPQVLKPKAYDPETGGKPVYEEQAYKLEKGFQIDASDPEKIPSLKIYDALKPKWVRFVYFEDRGIPSSIPSDVKILLIINQETDKSGEDIPPSHGRTIENLTSDERFYAWEHIFTQDDVNAWKNYTDRKYLPSLERFLQSGQKADAIQIWSEPDFCLGLTGLCIHPEAYAYMLKKSAALVKEYNRNVKVIVGGLASQNFAYVERMKVKEPDVFDQVDAIAIHPYGLYPDGPEDQPNGWCHYKSSECPVSLPYGGVGWVIDKYKEVSGLPVWITEVGQTTSAENWQARYFAKLSKVLSDKKVQVAIWYGWTDKILGPLGKAERDDQWGLVDDYGTIKAVGVEFQDFGED